MVGSYGIKLVPLGGAELDVVGGVTRWGRV